MCCQTQHVLTPSGSTCFVSSVFQTMSYAGSGSMCHPRSTTHWFGNQTMFSSELWSTAPVPAMWMPRNCVNLLPWKSLLVSTTVCACFNLPHCAFASFSFCLTLKVWRLREVCQWRSGGSCKAIVAFAPCPVFGERGVATSRLRRPVCCGLALKTTLNFGHKQQLNSKQL